MLTLRATFAEQNSEVRWEVSSYTIDENTGDYESKTVIAFPDRDSVRILLVKYINKYSSYKVLVFENEDRDSVEFQVFDKGVAQKYLFNNPIIPSKPIPVYIILPSDYSRDSKFVMSMHGTNRNAYDYANVWKSFASSNNYLIAAPEFSSTLWSSSAYILGNMFTGSDGTGKLNLKEYWTFYLVQLIHQELIGKCGLKDSSYIIWGHSAGAQFVHRMALFCPDNLITRYISANAGWYTAPDSMVIYPWGVKHDSLSISFVDLYEFTERNLVIMRGTADTLRDSDLNTQPLSDAQGDNRYERAGYFFNKGKEINHSISWPLMDVKDVGHEYGKMAIAAGSYILNAISTVIFFDDKIPDGFGIYNYPNPFNPRTTISFSIAQPAQTKIIIYNSVGQEVVELLNEYLPSGKHTRSFDPVHLASGIYFCKLFSGGYSKTIKIVLLK